MDVIPEDARFAAFRAAASEVGVRSSLSLPVMGVATPTSLNMYAGQPAAFVTQRSQAVARLLARCAAAVLSPGTAQAPTGSAAALDAALAGRQLILRAQHRLAVQAGITEAEAFTQLAKRSALEQCSIFEVAREVLNDQQREDA
jgi:ANTAR domain